MLFRIVSILVLSILDVITVLGEALPGGDLQALEACRSDGALRFSSGQRLPS